VTKRIDQLTVEVNKITTNESFTDQDRSRIKRDKYEIFLHPIIAILDHVHHMTIRLPAETPNEQQFKVNQHQNSLKSKYVLNK